MAVGLQTVRDLSPMTWPLMNSATCTNESYPRGEALHVNSLYPFGASRRRYEGAMRLRNWGVRS